MFYQIFLSPQVKRSVIVSSMVPKSDFFLEIIKDFKIFKLINVIPQKIPFEA